MRLGGELISKTSSCIRSIEQYFCVTSGSSNLGRQGAEQGGGGGGGGEGRLRSLLLQYTSSASQLKKG